MCEGFPKLLRIIESAVAGVRNSSALVERLGPSPKLSQKAGKAQPSREMVLRLSKVLELDLRERNALLTRRRLCGGISGDRAGWPALVPVNRAIDLLLAQQQPYGAILIDRCWNVLRANLARSGFSPRFWIRGSCLCIATNLVRATIGPAGLRPLHRQLC